MAIEDAKGILRVQKISKCFYFSRRSHRSFVAIENLKGLLRLHKPQGSSAAIEDFKNPPYTSKASMGTFFDFKFRNQKIFSLKTLILMSWEKSP